MLNIKARVLHSMGKYRAKRADLPGKTFLFFSDTDGGSPPAPIPHHIPPGAPRADQCPARQPARTPARVLAWISSEKPGRCPA